MQDSAPYPAHTHSSLDMPSVPVDPVTPQKRPLWHPCDRADRPAEHAHLACVPRVSKSPLRLVNLASSKQIDIATPTGISHDPRKGGEQDV